MKKLIKFSLCNIFLSFTLIISLYISSWVWTNYGDYMSIKFLELERKNIKNLKIINLGSSHTTYGIKYPNNIKGYNMGLSSQRFYYDYEILKKYSTRLSKNCIVIIPISIFSFYSGTTVEDISKNYIQFLDQNILIGVDEKEYFWGKYFSSTQPITKLPKALKFTFNFLKKRDFEKKYISYSQNLSLENKKKSAIEAAKTHLGITHSQFTNDKNIGIEQLKKILKFCERKGFRPILISTPQTYLYNTEVGQSAYQERIYENIIELEKCLNKKYIYLDYSHDERFEKNLEYFMDSDHLNEKGAEYFTGILLKDIKSCGYNID